MPRDELASLLPPKRGGAHDPALFTGLFRFTVRLFRANVGPLVAVGLAATAAALLAAAILEGVHSQVPFSGRSLGLIVHNGGDGPWLGLNVAMLYTGLITVALGAWSSATMVALLIGHVRSGRRARFGDLGCGLRYWPWVAVLSLLADVFDRGLYAVGRIGFGVFVPIALPVEVAGVILGVLFIFYVAEIVDAQMNGFAALGESWRLVRRVGFWRVLANRFLFGLCLLPVLVAELTAFLWTSNRYAAGAVSAQLLAGVVVAPLVAAFTTVLYLLAHGDRESLEAVLGPAGLPQPAPPPVAPALQQPARPSL